MVSFFAIRQHSTLIPANEESAEELEKLPHGATLEVEIKHDRSTKHLNLFWVLCKRIGDGQGLHKDKVSKNFKLALGYYDVERLYWPISSEHPAGEGYFGVVFKSIAIKNMDQSEFNDFFRGCVDVATTNWGIPYESLSDLLDDK